MIMKIWRYKFGNQYLSNIIISMCFFNLIILQ